MLPIEQLMTEPLEFDADGKVTKIAVPLGEWAIDDRGQSRYYTQRAGSLLHAAELLKAVPSVPEMTYYAVDTPDGALCRDVVGFYAEAPIKTSDLTLVTSAPVTDTVESVSLRDAYGDPMKQASSVAAQTVLGGQYAKWILFMECGRCGYQSPVETEPGAMERQCYCCGATNSTFRGAVNVVLPTGMVEV